jgi:hypothetical protein
MVLLNGSQTTTGFLRRTSLARMQTLDVIFRDKEGQLEHMLFPPVNMISMAKSLTQLLSLRGFSMATAPWRLD